MTEPRRPPRWSWIGVIGAVLVVGVVVAGGGDDPTGVEPTSLASEEPSEGETEAVGGGVLSDLFDRDNRPDVPELDCSSLLSDGEILAALGRNGPLVEEIEGEKCTDRISDAPGYFVTIEPGTPSHLDEGEPVDEVGAEAFWSPSRNLGTMTVLDETSLGFLIFRITVGRPDMAASEIRGVVTDLALAALPRFTDRSDADESGESVEDPPDLEVVTFGPEDAVPPISGYVDNLVHKEIMGEWSRAEGLVATLRLFAGEADASDVLATSGLADRSIDPILELALEYVRSSPEADGAAEISRLLSDLSYSTDVLDQATSASDPSATGQLWVAAGMDFHDEETADEFCQKMFGVDAPCLLPWLPPTEGDPPDPNDEAGEAGSASEEGPEYVVYQPTNGAGGWTDQYAEWALEAMVESGGLYETLGDMPSVALTLWAKYDNHTSLAVGEPCSISIGVIARDPIVPGGDTEGPFKQTIAARVAHCMLLNEGTDSEWWGQSMAVYLSGVVYPRVNREHLVSPFLRNNELVRPILERNWTNWVFWERLHPTLDAAGNLAFAAGSLSEVAEELHLMTEDLTDVSILDIGGGVVPYDPPSRSFDISSPVLARILPGYFGVMRLRAIVPPGRVACDIDYGPTSGITASWREGTPADGGGSWSRQLPEELSGRAVFVVTASAEGAELSMEIPRLEQEEDGCEPEEEEPDDAEQSTPPSLCGLCKSVFFWNGVSR